MEIEILLSVCFVILAALIVALVRNNIIYNNRIKAIYIIYRGTYPLGKFGKYPSYNKMFLDIKKWKFSSFFPDLAELEDRHEQG